jgi:hypothetical protein
MSGTGLKTYSLGIVVETKARNSDYIKVSPMEQLPFQNGRMSEQQQGHKVELPDARGVKRKSEVIGDNYIVAKWLAQSAGNRMTSPDVYKGETVKLFRFGDTDEYHWDTMSREPSLRRQETVNFAFSNIKEGTTVLDKNKKKVNPSTDKDSSYWFEVSTHDKRVQLHTANNDGEPFTYDIVIDTSTGVLTITDSIKNSIVLDSPHSTIVATANTEIVLVAPKVTIKGQLNIEGQVGIKGGLSTTEAIHSDKEVNGSNTTTTP